MHSVNKNIRVQKFVVAGFEVHMHQHLQLTPWQMQTLLPTYDGTVFISGDPHQNILLSQRGWRQRRHKDPKRE